MDIITLRPIGIIRTPFQEPRGTPIQSTAASEVSGTVQLLPEYVEGLKDLEGFSHLWLVYYFHQTGPVTLTVKPFLDDEKRGVFATRAPSRPNPVGLTLVRLDRVEGAVLHVREVDMVDGSPLLDIKPYVPEFDNRPDATIGWLTENVRKLQSVQDDGRFAR